MTSGEVPLGAVQCHKCSSVDGFVCSYARTKAIFSFSGLDSERRVIYAITHTTGLWKQGQRIMRVGCARCDADIPHWMLEFSSYVKTARS